MTTERTESLIVADEEAGQRIDAFLARRLGSPGPRRRCCAAEGNVTIAGKAVGKSRKATAGSTHRSLHPASAGPTRNQGRTRGRPQDHCRRRRLRRHRQARRRRRPPLARLGRPHRRRRAGRCRLPHLHLRFGRTPGHRPPPRCGHLRPDGRGQDRTRLHGRSSAPSRNAPRRRSTMRWSRACPTRWKAPSTPRWAAIPATTGNSPSSRTAATRSPTTRCLRPSAGPRWWRCTLETGRTHQIRVHFSALRHPCAGDQTYGADPKLAAALGLTRQWLHAQQLGFFHPVNGEWVEYTSDYPLDLHNALEMLRDGDF